MKILALRIDVDTFRGTRDGVPTLCRLLTEAEVGATFYFSVGPDNMGRHLWRLLKPAFLWKMLRSNAAGLYGPEIVLMGTAWPGPNIGKRLQRQIRAAADCGFEVGFHAWDHHFAQSRMLGKSPERMRRELRRGVEQLTRMLGAAPVSSAAPGWRCNDELLRVKAEFPFRYNSDCRGSFPFYPVLDGVRVGPLQIPVTLPTYDEVIGRDGVSDATYNDYQLGLLREDRANVLTIHAEAEGGRCRRMFEEYLKEVKARGFRVISLGELARAAAPEALEGRMALAPFPGREGTLAVQQVQE